MVIRETQGAHVQSNGDMGGPTGSSAEIWGVLGITWGLLGGYWVCIFCALQCWLMFDDFIAEVFAKWPKGGPGRFCVGLQKAHALISGDRGGPWGPQMARRPWIYLLRGFLRQVFPCFQYDFYNVS